MVTVDASAASQAIATIVGFPAQLDAAAKTLAGIPTGPWNISVVCHYGSSCCGSTAAYSPGTQLSSATLISSLGTAESHAKTFFSSFTSVTSWLKSLPDFSAAFESSSNEILSILDSIPAKQHPTPAQQKKLNAAFGTILSGLATGKSQLGKGADGIAAFLQAQIGITNDIGAAETSLVATAQAGLDQLMETIKTEPCGQAEAEAQFNAVKAENDSSVGQFQKEFGALSTQTGTANDAVGTVLGTVVDYEEQIKKISEDVTTASSGQLSKFMQKLNVQAAIAFWNELAKEATSQLGSNDAVIADVTARAA